MSNAHARVKHSKLMKIREKTKKPDCITIPSEIKAHLAFVKKYFKNHFDGDLSPYQTKLLESAVARFSASNKIERR